MPAEPSPAPTSGPAISGTIAGTGSGRPIVAQFNCPARYYTTNSATRATAIALTGTGTDATYSYI